MFGGLINTIVLSEYSMSDEIKIAEYRRVVALLWSIAHLVDGMKLSDLLESGEKADIMGPILDPTLYREKSNALREDMQLIRAFARLRKEIRSIPGFVGINKE